MSQHVVKFRVPSRPLQHADIEFEVFKNGEKFGELHVSKGAVVWRLRDHSKGKRVSWRKLAEFFQASGADVKP